MSEQTGKTEAAKQEASSVTEPSASDTPAVKPTPSKADILNAQWHRVRSRLRAELGEATFNSWFKLLEVRGAQKGRVTLQVPTRFVRSWIEAHYLTRIRDHWQAEDNSVRRIDIELQPEWAPNDKKPEVREQKAVAARKNPMAPRLNASSNAASNGATGVAPNPLQPARVPQATFEQGSRDELGAPLDARFTFDNFIVGKSNELAHAAARRLAEGEGVAFNPLFLYGGVGL
ncbi:MAG: hypothetical protein HOK33_04395, partial [Rhodobiaceae bacterium]|nr:hypothetical protein [Rhodobiaceae bacterium]